MAEDPFKIDFSREIGVREARTLCRHLVANLSGCYLDLNTKQFEHFGDRLRIQDYASPDEVQLSPGERNLSGHITRISDLSSTELNFLRCFDQRGRQRYVGLKLLFNAYDWDEINEKDRNLVQDVRIVVG
jgi:hypothetical protein